jgi:hypothetical protein
MRRLIAVFLAVVLAGILAPVALAQVWHWTGRIVTFNVAPVWWQYQPQKFCEYQAGIAMRYEPVQPGYGARLYCSPTLD